jgi:hypothetical protein
MDGIIQKAYSAYVTRPTKGPNAPNENIEIFVDEADGLLKYKDKNGVVTTLTFGAGHVIMHLGTIDFNEVNAAIGSLYGFKTFTGVAIPSGYYFMGSIVKGKTKFVQSVGDDALRFQNIIQTMPPVPSDMYTPSHNAVNVEDIDTNMYFSAASGNITGNFTAGEVDVYAVLAPSNSVVII